MAKLLWPKTIVRRPAIPAPTARSTTLVAAVRDSLKSQIEKGDYTPGDRLPSEAMLTVEYGVSRTVVREAIAALKADGLVEPRQGAGVFVIEPAKPVTVPFQNVDYARLSSIIELLELRTAVEVESAGLAAIRRSPSQEERIIEAAREIPASNYTAAADLGLHLAIADATNNPRFREFLTMLGSNVIPRTAMMGEQGKEVARDYYAMIDQEHDRIVTAILSGDEAGARAAMRQHLKGSQTRYRALLRS